MNQYNNIPFLRAVKSIALLLIALIALSFTACVDELGAGVPSAKSMYVESSEYTIDPTDVGGVFVLRWIDVGNATYKVSLTNNENDLSEELTNEQVSSELSTMYMNIPYSQLLDYVERAQLSVDSEDRQSFNVNITGTPIDLSLPTALDPEGSTVTAVVYVVSLVTSEEE